MKKQKSEPVRIFIERADMSGDARNLQFREYAGYKQTSHGGAAVCRRAYGVHGLFSLASSPQVEVIFRNGEAQDVENYAVQRFRKSDPHANLREATFLYDERTGEFSYRDFNGGFKSSEGWRDVPERCLAVHCLGRGIVPQFQLESPTFQALYHVRQLREKILNAFERNK